MKDYGMRWVKLDNAQEGKLALSHIGADPHGVALMAGKAVGRAIKLEKVPLRIAHILKQEMLAADGDAAVHRDVITNGIETTDIMLVGTNRQLEKVGNKLLAQPFGLKDIGKALKAILNTLEPAEPRILNCRGKELRLGERTLIMGILNVTPDSFSDGGNFFDIEDALKQAETLVKDGADILDIGAESTRPGHKEVSAEEEWSRLAPVLKELVDHIPVPISIDTYKAEVAAKSVEAGAHIINDIWGLQYDPDMPKVVGKYQVPVIVMHNKNGTEYQNMMGEIFSFLRHSINLAEENGLAGDQIILDPGIGFGKTTEQNLEVMARLDELRALGHPVLLGTSRKSMIGNTLKLPVDERLEGTLATSVLGVAAGVEIVRVHDVKENARAVQMADAILRGQRGFNFSGE